MALSDEIKAVMEQMNALTFAADALQQCLADPRFYAPSHGTDSKEYLLEMQLSLNSSIKNLRDKLNELYERSDALRANASLRAQGTKNIPG